MMMEMYSVWDKKTCVYHVPVCYHNAEQVKREMQMFLEGNPGNTLGRFPGDFCIMWVGRWDDNKGCLTPAAQPEWICDLSSLISKSPAAAPTEPGVIPFPGLAEAAPPLERGGGGRKARVVSFSVPSLSARAMPVWRGPCSLMGPSSSLFLEFVLTTHLLWVSFVLCSYMVFFS